MKLSERLGHEPNCVGGFGQPEKCDCVLGEIKPEIVQLEDKVETLDMSLTSMVEHHEVETNALQQQVERLQKLLRTHANVDWAYEEEI